MPEPGRVLGSVHAGRPSRQSPGADLGMDAADPKASSRRSSGGVAESAPIFLGPAATDGTRKTAAPGGGKRSPATPCLGHRAPRKCLDWSYRFGASPATLGH